MRRVTLTALDLGVLLLVVDRLAPLPLLDGHRLDVRARSRSFDGIRERNPLLVLFEVEAVEVHGQGRVVV
jgi:hypothetical protein